MVLNCHLLSNKESKDNRYKKEQNKGEIISKRDFGFQLLFDWAAPLLSGKTSVKSLLPAQVECKVVGGIALSKSKQDSSELRTVAAEVNGANNDEESNDDQDDNHHHGDGEIAG